MYFLLEMGIFHCYVSLPEGNMKNCLQHTNLHVKFRPPPPGRPVGHERRTWFNCGWTMRAAFGASLGAKKESFQNVGNRYDMMCQYISIYILLYTCRMSIKKDPKIDMTQVKEDTFGGLLILNNYFISKTILCLYNNFGLAASLLRKSVMDLG